MNGGKKTESGKSGSAGAGVFTALPRRSYIDENYYVKHKIMYLIINFTIFIMTLRWAEIIYDGSVTLTRRIYIHNVFFTLMNVIYIDNTISINSS